MQRKELKRTNVSINIKALICVISLLASASCVPGRCDLDLTGIGNQDDRPFIHLDSMIGPCTYEFTGHFFHERENFYEDDVVLKGLMLYSDSVLSIVSDTTFKRPAKLFDFKRRSGELYQVAIEISDTLLQYSISMDTVVYSKEYGKVVLFRMGEVFPVFDVDSRLDVVFVASTRNGVLASFTSEMAEDGTQLVSFKAGNLLPSIVDYSRHMDGVFK